LVRGLVQIAFDFTFGSNARLGGVLAGVTQCAALPQQIPTLIELHLEATQPSVLLGLIDLVVLQLGAEILLLGHQLVDPGENVGVFGVGVFGVRVGSHRLSLPDYGVTVATKPEIEFPDGPAPAELVIDDVIVGDGAEAMPGGTVTVHYVGVEYDTGEEFDSSWNRNESIEFPLRGLIEGWQDGIPGMKVGGRRKLTIPPAKAYGAAGSGHRLSGKTLIFVIDLLAAS
jgi:peptidylprolyl isomerase